jgi:hypothetical protein
MALEGSPLVALAQQGAEAANYVIVQRSADNPRGELSVGNRSNDQVASGNRHLADNDAHRWITQNCQPQECGRDCDDLYNIIDDQMRLRVRSLTPPRCSLARDVTPSGRGDFRALALPLRQVIWPEKFKTGHINKYDGSSNPEEFIQVYHTVIETAGGDNRVKANYLPTALSGVAKSWLINLLERSIYTWDQLCAMLIENFQGMYKRPSTAETLKTIKQKHDERL